MKTTPNQKKVFIVEDDPFYRAYLKELLGRHKHISTQVFSCAEDCLEHIGENPDLILLDFYLDLENKHNISGHHFLEYVDKNTARKKVVFITGEHNETLMESYHTFRSMRYILKDHYAADHINSIIKQLAA